MSFHTVIINNLRKLYHLDNLINLSEFPSFQELLQQENFPTLVLKLCETDSECFVRASALKCLQHMVKSDVLWEEFFEQEQFPVSYHPN